MIQSRRQFMNTTAKSAAVLTFGLSIGCSYRKNRPNILWITSEDNSPFFGCYGDAFATTPNFDKLAKESVLYENAFATTPVCAPSRNTLITGLYANSLGNEHMRSRYPIPDFIQKYPVYLHQAGYYCTNNAKTDYNYLGEDKDGWDESSRHAYYINRAEGQPFFAILNLGVSHESSVHESIPSSELRHRPREVPIPPYHPDTPDVRHDWAQYYDKIEDLDRQVGAILQELADNGLAENTIVFYYSDHGGVLARSKRFLYDSGLHVPLMIRFPQKYQHLAPGKPGSRTDQIVTFVDFPKTVLSLAGVQPPAHMQGHAFLGHFKEKPRQFAQSYRGRMDERYDLSRTIRDKQFRYTRNYNPHRPYGQYLQYLWRAPLSRSWEVEYHAGRCNEIQRRFWEAKPAEELYDSKNDPWEVNNLIYDPAYKEIADLLRAELRQWMLAVRDSGFLPEGKLVDISKISTVYDYVHSDLYDLERILETAEMATDYDEFHLAELRKRLKDPDATVRFWAATGCLILAEKAETAAKDLITLLHDADGDVVAVAAEALVAIGQVDDGVNALIKLLHHSNSKVVLRALNALTEIGAKAAPARSALQALIEHQDDYVKRATAHLLQML
ncbi:sulfatase [candidate division KSB1 bacterium]|nr:sulfatase-like hydrolase/transferase [candidate division KSB1 bacterium]RQW06995.1 MAG: sulfatase [candidate division KSB1 bacterium]